MPRATGKPTRRSAMLHALPFALCSALCFTLAFPPFNLALLAPLSLIPLVRLAQTTARARWAGVPVLLCFAGAFGYHHQWMFAVTAAGTPLLLAYLALYPTAFVLILSKLRFKRVSPWTIAPFLWVLLEIIRGHLFSGYAWYCIAHPFEPHNNQYFFGFLLAFPICTIGQFCSLLPDFARPRFSLRISVSKLVLIAPVLWLYLDFFAPSPYEIDSDTGILNVASIQTNVPQDNKVAWTLDQRIEDFQRMLDLTREAAQSNPDLIVWPETMFPGYTLSPAALQAARDAGIADTNYDLFFLQFADALTDFQRELGIPMLVGAIGVDDLAFDLANQNELWTAGAIYNSAFLIADGEIQPERYDKIHLTPFGEVMPYISRFDWLESALLTLGAGGMTFDLSAGSRPTVFEVPCRNRNRLARIVTPICFEATTPAVCRNLIGSWPNDADLMINLTNDGWFGSFDPARENHIQIARWRCTENRTPMLRAANTGISCAIDAGGAVTESLPPRTEGILHAWFPIHGP